jgi:hypothetical protein
MTLQTDHVMAVFDGPDVSRLEAGPEVSVTGFGGRARFQCADVVIDLPTSSSADNAYRGIMHEVFGYYRATSFELGIEGSAEYDVNFTADVLRLEPEVAILENPCLSLGDLENPELAIQSREIRFEIGSPPEGPEDERAVLGAEADGISLRIFGNRINVLPFPISHGFFHARNRGLKMPVPMFGWEGDEGFRWDQNVEYDFADQSVDDGPNIRLHFDVFPFSRSYPELTGDFKVDGIHFVTRAGYRREEDENGDAVPVRAEPEFIVGLDTVPIGESDFGIGGEAFWGHLRDMTLGPDLDRWGFRTTLEHNGVWLGDFHLSGGLRFSDIFYEGGDDYRILEGRARLRYAQYPDWSASIVYRNSRVWGETPFRFDVPQYGEEVGLREQTRISSRWGAGFDYLWDFDEDDFGRQEWHLTYIFDSFQVSTGWDFENDMLRVRFDLPGSLR